MNLHGLVRGVITSVNPDVTVTLTRATGQVLDQTTGKYVVSSTATAVSAQVQPLSSDDLMHVNNLGMQGYFQAFYLYGIAAGTVRADATGGDTLTDGAGKVWRVMIVSEQWPDWVRVIACLQA